MPTPAPRPAGQQVTISGVQCWDMSVTERIDRNGHGEAIRTVQCAWTDRWTLYQNLRSGAIYGPGNIPVLGLAATYPDAPNLLFFDSIQGDMVPVGGLGRGQNGMVSTLYAEVKIRYATIDYLEGTTIGTVTIDYAMQFFQPPDNCLQWAGGPNSGNPLPSGGIPGIRLNIKTYRISRKQLVTMPWSALRDVSLGGVLGAVNSEVFVPPIALGSQVIAINNGPLNPLPPPGVPSEPIGTVLFSGATQQRRLTMLGAENWDLDLVFECNPLGWNSAPDPQDHGNFHPYVNAGTMQPPILSANLNTIFTANS